MSEHWYLIPLNPEPWAVGDAGIGRKNGKLFARISPEPNLKAFQEAVKEETEDWEMLPYSEFKLTFYLWRQQVSYISTSDKRVQRHQADATNMQKALEDALQGVLFDNDRAVRDIRTVVVAQGPNVVPKIIIKAEEYVIFEDSLPAHVQARRTQKPETDNVWRGPEDKF